MLQRNQELLKQLPQDALWKYFLMCTEVPRPSKHMGPIREMIIGVAKDLGLEYDTDDIGNIVIRKPATAGKENAPGVILQSHMDMVPSNNEDIEHDWKKDPLHVVKEGNTLTAVGTTLGADDGIGIAACLAVLESKTMVHGPLEALFTVDEEDDMSGAEKLARKPFLKGEILVNVDSEEEQSVCMGCAGGFEAHINMTAPLSSISSDVYAVSLKGLLGGHTGCDIHLGRGNAILVLSRIITMAMKEHDIKIVELVGGTAINAIPREATAKIACDAAAITAIKAAYGIVALEYSSVEVRDGNPIMSLAVEKTDKVNKAIKDSQRIMDMIAMLPYGVVRMSPDVEGQVESSICASIICIKDDAFFAHMFGRSSRDTQMERMFAQLQAIGRLTGASVSSEMIDYFPGWTPRGDSKAATVFESANVMVYGKKPLVYAVHAGLECGFIAKAYPDLDQVSIGPTITGAHSPDECVFIDTCDGFMKVLAKGLEMLTE